MRAGKIIATGAGMAVDHAETGGLAPQIGEDARQHDMLVDVGEITGVKRVLIVHLGMGPTLVMAGFVPAIHVFCRRFKTWMPDISP